MRTATTTPPTAITRRSNGSTPVSGASALTPIPDPCTPTSVIDPHHDTGALAFTAASATHRPGVFGHHGTLLERGVQPRYPHHCHHRLPLDRGARETNLKSITVVQRPE